jgi:hypothetical protein
MIEHATHVSPSPVAPTEAEEAFWSRLTRREQLDRYRGYLSHPECDEVSASTMADILAAARAAAGDCG